LSQVFTLYTTPVIYLYLDRVRSKVARWSARLPWNRRSPTITDTPDAPDTGAQ
jgi:multidrug efflux pump